MIGLKKYGGIIKILKLVETEEEKAPRLELRSLAPPFLSEKRPSSLGLFDYYTGSEFFAYNSLILSILSVSEHLILHSP